MLRRTTVVIVQLALVAVFAASSSYGSAVDELAPVRLVLDSSGSMTARDVGAGGTRLDAARRSVAFGTQSVLFGGNIVSDFCEGICRGDPARM